MNLGLAFTAVACVLAMAVAAPARSRAIADGKVAKDPATWKEIFGDKDLDAAVKSIQDELKTKVMKTKGTFLPSYKKAMQAGYALAALGNVGTVVLEKDEAKSAAALREAGIAFAKAAKAKNFDEAKEAFAKIEGYPKKIDPAASAEPVKWSEAIPLASLMENVNRIDGDVQKAGKQATEFSKSYKDLAIRTKLLAALAVIAREEHQDKADWQGWCEDMRAGCLETSKQLAAKNQNGTKNAYTAVTKSCTKCHEVYQDKN
jgi:hypothetical protein